MIGRQYDVKDACCVGTAVPTSPVSEISEQFTYLDNRLTDLEGMIQQLESRLQPILTDSYPYDDSAAKASSVGSVMGYRIETNSSRVFQLSNAVERIINRLAI